MTSTTHVNKRHWKVTLMTVVVNVCLPNVEYIGCLCCYKNKIQELLFILFFSFSLLLSALLKTIKCCIHIQIQNIKLTIQQCTQQTIDNNWKNYYYHYYVKENIMEYYTV